MVRPLDAAVGRIKPRPSDAVRLISYGGLPSSVPLWVLARFEGRPRDNISVWGLAMDRIDASPTVVPS